MRTGINKLSIAVTFLLAISCNTILSQEKIVIGEIKSIKSKVLDEERYFSIYLPENYSQSKQKYPVVYVLDGRTHFHQVTGAVQFMSNARVIPKMIVVAIHNVDRTRDFSPVYTEDMPNTGGGEKFLNFLDKELTKYIDENYKTSDFRVLIGHSFGGTFAAYALLERPEVFDSYIAISPYLHFADSYLVKEAQTSLKEKYNEHKCFYMSVGDEPDYFEPLSKFSALVQSKSPEGIDFEYVRMKNEDHGTTPYLTVFNGLRFTFADWQLPAEVIEAGIQAIDKHFEHVSEKYGVKVVTPENLLNIIGYTYLQKGDIQKAIEIFEENAKRFPISSNVYDSLGEAFEKDGQLDKAKESYQKAYDLGTVQNHVNVGIYEANLKRVKNK